MGEEHVVRIGELYFAIRICFSGNTYKRLIGGPKQWWSFVIHMKQLEKADQFSAYLGCDSKCSFLVRSRC